MAVIIRATVDSLDPSRRSAGAPGKPTRALSIRPRSHSDLRYPLVVGSRRARLAGAQRGRAGVFECVDIVRLLSRLGPALKGSRDLRRQFVEFVRRPSWA
jgi:hypothetical protein